MDNKYNDGREKEYEDFRNEAEPQAETGEKKPPGAKKGLWAVLGGLGLVLLKFKTVLFLVLGKLKFLFIFLKLGKFLTTFGSMFVMILVYARMYGLPFGIGFVLLLFVHELGHYWVARRLSLNVSVPVFIPFVGALISMKEQPGNAVTEAKMAAGGPILGSLGALLCAALYPVTKQDFYLALAYTGFMINIFNLIPVHPLDGGRIVSAISPKLWFVGLPIMLIVAIRFFNPIIFLFLILGGVQAYRHWKAPAGEYYNTPAPTRLAFAGIYFGLVALLGIGMAYIHQLHSVSL